MQPSAVWALPVPVALRTMRLTLSYAQHNHGHKPAVTLFHQCIRSNCPCCCLGTKPRAQLLVAQSVLIQSLDPAQCCWTWTSTMRGTACAAAAASAPRSWPCCRAARAGGQDGGTAARRRSRRCAATTKCASQTVVGAVVQVFNTAGHVISAMESKTLTHQHRSFSARRKVRNVISFILQLQVKCM